MKPTIQNRQAWTEVAPSASALLIQTLKEPLWDGKKHSKHRDHNSTFDGVVNTAWQMQHQPLARELSGTIQEILGTSQFVGCQVDGCHPCDTIDDISSGPAECPAS